MASPDHWPHRLIIVLLGFLFFQSLHEEIGATDGFNSSEILTACQHLRRAESRRAKALINSGTKVRVPRCTKFGQFEKIQCSNETGGFSCWCVDEYGVEIPGTKVLNRSTNLNCNEPAQCSASSCRMFCGSGFKRDATTGCSICKCRDPCENIECGPGGVCQQQEVKCNQEPCPPIPTCKKARSLTNWCQAGEPLRIADSVRPFLCGLDAGKPQCPPLFDCLVDSGNDYGVCCSNALQYHKPGTCEAKEEDNNALCGDHCSHDLECPQFEKCCYSKRCGNRCRQPNNVTSCHQAKVLSEILAVNEREGRGYIPDCNGTHGNYSPKQCSRNGLVCWCVNTKTGNKIPNTMGPSSLVTCEGVENIITRSQGRSVSMNQCDTNICASICEYGFKTDHNGCPTCECSDPCDGYLCRTGSHCEVAKDELCVSGSALCASVPLCKPDLVYSNPCEIGTPMVDNKTSEVLFCQLEERHHQPRSFFDEDGREGRVMPTNQILCPENFKCTKLYKEPSAVCCPLPKYNDDREKRLKLEKRQQTICEYLRDFSELMEGEEGIKLALDPPRCETDGSFAPRQCGKKIIRRITSTEKRRILEADSIRKIRSFLRARRKRDSISHLRLLEDSAVSDGRSAKVIDISPHRQNFGDIFLTDTKKTAAPVKKSGSDKEELQDFEILQCWCVDNFGAEIPHSRGTTNITDETCLSLRESLDCLDLTCRMGGCDYGFTLDQDTRCPTCQCRDPCEGVICSEGRECRTVDVACQGEYCAPVPACLPRKPGQCPFLVPPGSDLDADACSYECRSDSHCEGSNRCCSNGCGTQCVEPQFATSCQHLQRIQRHQASELGIPAKRTYIAQCDPVSGKWNKIQCGSGNVCWCVDESGREISGTRTNSGKPAICEENSVFICPSKKCSRRCEFGYKTDEHGCRICECRNPCDEISCLPDEECQLLSVECIDAPCSKVPICVPKRDSICAEGSPLMLGNKEVSCGPQNENEFCPTTHACQLSPISPHRGFCCLKTRDVCFETMTTSCLAKHDSIFNITKWRFSPRMNKCISIIVDNQSCQGKNLFHSEQACMSVCPVLTQCERLKLKNSLAAKRTGHTSVWFEPNCDPKNGQWNPIQCLGKQPNPPQPITRSGGISREFSTASVSSQLTIGVCWCADKRGAPIKGTLTKDLEPLCSYRQARRRMYFEEPTQSDPVMEDLIRQITDLVDFDDNDVIENIKIHPNISAVTEKVFTLANAMVEDESKIASTKRLMKTTSRCHSLSQTASFPVACDDLGAFLPTQCNGDQCWCVDAAGNQLVSTSTFKFGEKECLFTSIDSVLIKLHLLNKSGGLPVQNLYDVLRTELIQLLGNAPENLRVQENIDGSSQVKFELHDEFKIDVAFAIEEMVRQNNIFLGNGNLKPDPTLSRFIHRIHQEETIPVPEPASGMTENTFQTIVFVIATASAFLVSILVVFIMLKRGTKKKITSYPENRVLDCGDKYLDLSSPIFVLSANEKSINSCQT